jgi:hypothetical protein
MSSEKHMEVREGADGPEWLVNSKPGDYDGHTSFSELTPDQRLDWLQRAADLMRDLKGKAAQGQG